MPILAINPIPGQEEENARFIEVNNVGIWLKKQDDIDSILNKFITDDTALSAMHTNALSISKSHSTKNICDQLLKKH